MIKVSVDEFWEYFQTYKGDLKENCHCIASADDGNTKVWLSCERELPVFEVEMNGHTTATSKPTYKLQAEEKYDNILYTFIDPDDAEESEESDLAPEDEDRVAEIYDATEDFLRVLLEGDPFGDYGLEQDDIEEFTKYCEQYISDYFGCYCRHPVVLSDGTITDYPTCDGFPS